MIEIARRGLAKDYIVGLKRLEGTFDLAVRVVMDALKIDVSEVFHVESAEHVPLRTMGRQSARLA